MEQFKYKLQTTGIVSPPSVNVSKCRLGQLQFDRLNWINVLLIMPENHLPN